MFCAERKTVFQECVTCDINAIIDLSCGTRVLRRQLIENRRIVLSLLSVGGKLFAFVKTIVHNGTRSLHVLQLIGRFQEA